MTIPGLASADTGLLEAPQVPDTVDETLQKAPTASPPPLDTVQETIDSVLDPVEDATKPVKDAVKPVTDPVKETVDPVTDTIDEGTTPITDVIDDPTNPVIDDNGTGENDTGGATTRPPDSTSDGATGRPLTPVLGDDVTGQAATRDTVVDAGSRPPAPAPVAIDAGLRPTPSVARGDAATDRGTASGPSATDQIARAVVDASRAFRFPLLAAAAVLLFLAIQGRIDGRDPKLARSQDDEELIFA